MNIQYFNSSQSRMRSTKNGLTKQETLPKQDVKKTYNGQIDCALTGIFVYFRVMFSIDYYLSDKPLSFLNK